MAPLEEGTRGMDMIAYQMWRHGVYRKLSSVAVNSLSEYVEVADSFNS